MTAQHYSTDPDLAARFAARVLRDPPGAVHLVIASGLTISREDLPTPFSDAFDGIPKNDVEQRGNFQIARAAELSLERRAIALVTHAASIRGAQVATAAKATAADRATAVERRALELEQQWWETRRAEWRAQAEREVDGGDGPPVPPPAANARPRPRRVVDITNDRKASIQ